MTQYITNIDYLNGDKCYNVIEFQDDATDEACQIKLKPISKELSFDPKWFPTTVHGYHQWAEVPKENMVDMNDAVKKWAGRWPENGVPAFFDNRDDYDAFVSQVKAQFSEE